MAANVHVGTLKTREDLVARMDGARPAVVYLGARWARVDAATRAFLTQQLPRRAPGADFFVLDERDCFPITDHFGIRTFPTTVVLKEGVVHGQVVGGSQGAITRVVLRACGAADPQQQPTVPAAAGAGASGGAGGYVEPEDEMLHRAIEESKLDAERSSVASSAAASSSSSSSSSGNGMRVPTTEEIDAAKLAECLAAVQQVNLAEKKKKEQAAKAATEAQEEAQRQIAAVEALASSAVAEVEEEEAQPAGTAAATAAAAEVAGGASGGSGAADTVTAGTADGEEAAATGLPADGPHGSSSSSSSSGAGDGSGRTAAAAEVPDPLDGGLLAQLLELGISRAQAAQAVRHSNATTVDAAMGWIVAKQETDFESAEAAHQARGAAAGEGEAETGAGESSAEGGGSDAVSAGDGGEGRAATAPKAKSIRCTDTGKVFRTMVDAQIYAERTGHMNFEECEEEVREKTAEEKAADRAALLRRLKENKAKKAAQEKEHERLAEIERRRQGMLAIKQAEEMKAAQRKREVERIKKEKAEKAEAKRKQLELWEQDHRERVSGTAAAAAARGPRKLTVFEAEAKVKKSIESLKTYDGGVGRKCLSTLAIYIANAQKGDPKFHRINLGNKAFKNRVAGCIGHGAVLVAAGFEKVTPGDDASPEGFWRLKEQDEKKLTAVLALLERAKRSPGFK